jgi:hypothetical protein
LNSKDGTERTAQSFDRHLAVNQIIAVPELAGARRYHFADDRRSNGDGIHAPLPVATTTLLMAETFRRTLEPFLA